MSSKSSIFLTDDNEHCYEECKEPIYDKDNNFLGFEICLELSKQNVTVAKDSEGWSIYFGDPNSEIYKLIKTLKDKENEIRKNNQK